MTKLKLLPLSNESVEERVMAFRQYNDEVGWNSHFFVVIYMIPECISFRYDIHILFYFHKEVLILERKCGKTSTDRKYESAYQ